MSLLLPRHSSTCFQISEQLGYSVSPSIPARHFPSFELYPVQTGDQPRCPQLGLLPRRWHGCEPPATRSVGVGTWGALWGGCIQGLHLNQEDRWSVLRVSLPQGSRPRLLWSPPAFAGRLLEAREGSVVLSISPLLVQRMYALLPNTPGLAAALDIELLQARL